MSITIKRTAESSQSKGLPGTAIFKMTARDFHNSKGCQRVLQSKLLSGSATIKSTDKDCQNKKDCQIVLQSKVLPGVSQSKELPRSIIILANARE